MSRISIIIASEEGGLDGVAAAYKKKIIHGTQREFARLATFAGEDMADVGSVMTGASGWIAFAEDR